MWPFNRNNAGGIRSSQPYWLMRNGIGEAGNALTASIDCDIAVIGAGITGALIADALVATRQRIVVLEARDAAQGSTAASTALLQYEIDTHLTDLARMFGAERAVRAYRACADSFHLLEQQCAGLLADCDYQRRESLYLAQNESSLEPLRRELDARRAIGLQCEWLERQELEQRFGCRRPGAILSALGAQVDPYRLTRALLTTAVRHGVRLFARSKVTLIEARADCMLLRTEAGPMVRAAQVVVAAGYESLEFLPLDVADINNTFALVTEPLVGRESAAAMPLIWESRRPYLYMRGTADGRLIVGGADLPFKSAALRETLLPRQVGRLADGYQDMFGVKLPPIAYAWAGSFATTRDGLPYIGRVPGMDPRLQFALCYGGNGITYSAHAAHMVLAGIEGRKHALEEVFGFDRLGATARESPKEGAFELLSR
jgi:glycine/D-amino acid oxidase-like deaminating enzyme